MHVLPTALLLASFVLPSPWGLVECATLDIADTGAFLWWSKRRKASVGGDTPVGTVGVAVGELWPAGQVKVNGEIWKAHCTGSVRQAPRGSFVRSTGLTLEVKPALARRTYLFTDAIPHRGQQ